MSWPGLYFDVGATLSSRFCNLGQRYAYTGCAAGRAVIYDLLSGEIVQVPIVKSSVLQYPTLAPSPILLVVVSLFRSQLSSHQCYITTLASSPILPVVVFLFRSQSSVLQCSALAPSSVLSVIVLR
jgi:hypothetical protein